MSEESQAEVQKADRPRFQFVRQLGRGVLGEAYEVIDEVRGEPVVLKVFLRARPRNPDRFKLEFESLARLEHPSLVRFHHLVDPASDTNVAIESRLGQGFAFTQEYVDGVDLTTWLRREATDEDLITLETRRTPTTGEIPLPDNPDESDEGDEGDEGDVATAEAETADAEGLAPESEAESVSTGAVEVSTDELARELSGDEDTASSIVEELATKSEALRDDVPLDLVLLRLEHVVPQIVAGLQYLHRFQKVHGFLRPSNILVARDGTCKFTDYGILPGLLYRPETDDPDAPPGDAVSLLQAPEHIPYVAPETSEEVTPEADLYALGCVLFEAIAGYPPGDALEFVPGRNSRLETPPLAEIVPECPARWAERVDALLRPNPADRPSLGAISEVMGGREGRVVQVPLTHVPEPVDFVGQKNLISELREEARLVSDEARMRLLLLEGVAGSGKSMAIDEISHWLSRRGWLVIGGRCFNRESVPYQGWHEIARSIAAICEDLPPMLQETVEDDRRLAAVLFPELSPGGAPVEHTDSVGRLAAIRALRRLLGFLAEQRPILLCIEDLHWASWDTASLLMDLFSETAEIPCLVLGTWRVDSDRSEDHFLRRDLDVSLLQVRRLSVTGFTSDEAREFLVSRAPGAPIAELRRIIAVGRSNPRLLRELVWELDEGHLEDVNLSVDRGRLLPKLYAARMSENDKRHDAILNILAVASGPLDQDWLERAVNAELSGSVLPTEQTEEAIHEAFDDLERLRLIEHQQSSRGTTQWVMVHDVCREVVLEKLSERDRARLAGRIADTVGHQREDRHDLQFEYELRAHRVAKAVPSAVRAARVAEDRFAYHRAAKLWRWILDNEEKVNDPTVDAAAELARTEHLAGQHQQAAELYHEWAEKTSDRHRRASILGKEAQAFLCAGDIDASVGALERAFGALDETYLGRWHAAISETPRRLVATLVRWNQQLIDSCEVGAASKQERVRAKLYDFALEFNSYLVSERGPEIESRLARLAETTADAEVLGLHRARLAVLHASNGDPSRRDRAFQWVDEAERIFKRVDDLGLAAKARLSRAVLHVMYGEVPEAREALSSVVELNREAEDVRRSDRRASLYWQARFHLLAGELSEAVRVARQLLHTYRGDHIVASGAYEVLAKVALLEGDAPLAAAFLDAGATSMESTEVNEAEIGWAIPRTQLHIALGRPEVAVGQLDVLWERLVADGRGTDAAFAVPVHLALGQASAALAERQKVLSEPRRDATVARLRDAQKRLDSFVAHLNPMRQAQVLRLFARVALALGKPRKALRHVEAAIEAIGGSELPIEVACCTEAHGVVLSRLERPEARGIIDQAWELYRHCGVAYPLVLEGWPVPREVAMLKED